jgi:hypothetical protein
MQLGQKQTNQNDVTFVGSIPRKSPIDRGQKPNLFDPLG